MPLEAQSDALIGAVLEGRFQIDKLLGEGGMGRVYVAEELRLKRRCAVKVLLPELTQDKGCVERFLREAQAIAQIHHENVVDIYHLGEDIALGVVFFAMELLSGEDLETRLLDRARRPLSWQQVVLWMAQVAGAVGAVHGAGMIHRDLKPSNIFIARRRDGRDQIKLLDFGIAKVANHAALTNTGAAIGTPFYMSPEQILAQALDTRTDIYSFGVLFFETLAGRMPFVGEPIQVAMQHCNVPPPKLSEINPEADIPPELEDLVLRMLAKDRDARPQSMDEIEVLLQDFLPSQTAMMTSGMLSSGVSRSITGPIARVSEAPHPTPAGGVPQPMTPAHGLSAVTPPGLRTSVDPLRPPATTVEIHLEGDKEKAPARKLAPLLMIGVVLVGVAVALFAFLAGDDPPPRPDPTPVAAPPPPETRALPPPETKVEPPPETKALPADPDPPTNPPETPPTKADEPRGGKKSGEPRTERPTDPMRQLQKAATACRKTHKATKGPKISVDYAIGSDGSVTRAVPSVQDALGKCLADAVKRTKFPPQLKLGLKIDL
jgi:serine/threonine protein kinase